VPTAATVVASTGRLSVGAAQSTCCPSLRRYSRRRCTRRDAALSPVSRMQTAMPRRLACAEWTAQMLPLCAMVRLTATAAFGAHNRALGGRAFPDAAARAWNSLPSFVKDQQSLAAFRQQLKTVLLRTSFGEDANA